MRVLGALTLALCCALRVQARTVAERETAIRLTGGERETAIRLTGGERETAIRLTGGERETEQTRRGPIQQYIERRKAQCLCDNAALTCNCCVGIHIQQAKFNQQGCLKFAYSSAKLGVRLNVLANNMTLYETNIAKVKRIPNDDVQFSEDIELGVGRNPPPFCIPIPQFPLVQICVRLHDIHLDGKNLVVCAKLEAQAFNAPIFVASFDCLKIGADGVGIQKPTSAQTTPGRPAAGFVKPSTPSLSSPSTNQDAEIVSTAASVLEDDGNFNVTTTGSSATNLSDDDNKTVTPSLEAGATSLNQGTAASVLEEDIKPPCDQAKPVVAEDSTTKLPQIESETSFTAASVLEQDNSPSTFVINLTTGVTDKPTLTVAPTESDVPLVNSTAANVLEESDDVTGAPCSKKSPVVIYIISSSSIDSELPSDIIRIAASSLERENDDVKKVVKKAQGTVSNGNKPHIFSQESYLHSRVRLGEGKE